MDAREAERIARERFGIAATATPLAGEHDLNYRLQAADGRLYVLKLHAPGADRAALELQDAALAEVGAPRLVGASYEGERVVRLLSWLEGRPWAEAPGEPAGLGRLVAETDAALARVEHPARERDHHWSLLAAPDAARAMDLLDGRRRGLVAPVFARFAELDLGALPRQLIHNDANEHNVLVAADGSVAGLIDFGDLVVGAAGVRAGRRAGLRDAGREDPVRAVAPVVRGYHEVAPLRRTSWRCSTTSPARGWP